MYWAIAVEPTKLTAAIPGWLRIASIACLSPLTAARPGGRKVLYINGGHTVRFKDMTEAERTPLFTILVRAPAAPGIHLPLPVGGRLDRVLGQSLYAAQPDQRLSRLSPGDASGDPGRRHAALSP
jgi:hypothetical protein